MQETTVSVVHMILGSAVTVVQFPDNTRLAQPPVGLGGNDVGISRNSMIAGSRPTRDKI